MSELCVGSTMTHDRIYLMEHDDNPEISLNPRGYRLNLPLRHQHLLCNKGLAC